MDSRSEIPAPDMLVIEQWGDAVGKVSHSNGQEWCLCGSGGSRQIPIPLTMTHGPSLRKQAEVTRTQAAQKSR